MIWLLNFIKCISNPEAITIMMPTYQKNLTWGKAWTVMTENLYLSVVWKIQETN